MRVGCLLCLKLTYRCFRRHLLKISSQDLQTGLTRFTKGSPWKSPQSEKMIWAISKWVWETEQAMCTVQSPSGFLSGVKVILHFLRPYRGWWLRRQTLATAPSASSPSSLGTRCLTWCCQVTDEHIIIISDLVSSSLHCFPNQLRDKDVIYC